LLRAMAGLWPHATGSVARPPGQQSLFLPQRPYMPVGSLRLCLHYPGPAQADGQAASALRICHLEHLLARLDEDEDWTQILSLGEQQRLAVGRVLLNRPQLAFLDEATSAMDEGLEHDMYLLLQRYLTQTILVSVGHRSTLQRFHTQVLELHGQGRWRLAHKMMND
jgi:vitamin B12/bleomycin/antimicrobial peptide transport system ATP-binding/permease protein